MKYSEIQNIDEQQMVNDRFKALESVGFKKDFSVDFPAVKHEFVPGITFDIYTNEPTQIIRLVFNAGKTEANEKMKRLSEVIMAQ